MRLEDRFKVDYVSPFQAVKKTDENDGCDGVHGTSDFVRGRVDEFGTEGCRGIVS